ncbi:ABC transporter substrate-binding protein [Haladaptatus sp. NG-WS-4]
MVRYTNGEQRRSSASRRNFLKATGVATATGIAGCIGMGNSSAPDSVTFGQPAALTGKWDFLQPAVSQASDLAVKQINDAGGPLGAKLKLKRRDTAVSPQQAKSVFEQLINNDNAIAINGLFSSEITPLFDFLVEKEVPINTPWPGSTALDTKGGDHETPDKLSDDEWIWRTTISDTVHTAGAAKNALSNGTKKVGVINGTSQGERSWADAFISAYKNGGGKVVKKVEVEEGKSSYQAELERLFQADFDGFVVALALEDATTLLRDWSNAGYGNQPILEDTLASNDLVKAVGKDLKGAWVSSPTGQGPYYKEFVSAFKKAGDAELHAWAAPAYDAVVSTALALHKAGEASTEAIEKNLGPITRDGGTKVSTFEKGMKEIDNGNDINFQGAGTPVNFTGYGNVLGDVAITTMTGNKFEQTKVIKAKELSGVVDEY